MARIRTVKPDLWIDEDLAEVSEPAMILAIGLLNHADDEGYFKANPKIISSVIFPIREPSVSIPVMLRELSGIGYIKLFKGSDGKEYGLVTNFKKHQAINKPTKSKISELINELENITEDYGSATGGLPVGKERKGKERNDNNGENDSPVLVDKTENLKSDYSPLFERFWKALPDGLGEKGSKKQAWDEFKKLQLTESAWQDIYRKINLIAKSKIDARSAGEFAAPFPHVCRMIKNRIWESAEDIQPARSVGYACDAYVIPRQEVV